MTQTLIPSAEYGSAVSQLIDVQTPEFSDSTREMAGEIVREGSLIRKDETGTSWQNNDSFDSTQLHKVRLAAPVIRLPAGTLPHEQIQVLQQWEGVITEIKSDSFCADLRDLGDASQPLEVMEIPIDEMPRDDRSLVVEGGIFYWSIGYETTAGGQLRRVSEIRMRRAPRWTKRGIRRVKKRAEDLFELYGK